MIPILYAGTEQNFLNNGLGRLSDAISCKVTEERNGIFELEMTYPITGIHYQEIALNNIILAKTEEGGTNQAFIIYSITRPINGIVTVKANHISYLLNGFVVMPFEAVSLADAMSKISQNAVTETPFSFTTDISSTIAFKFDTPRSIRSLLGGEQGSLLDTYGGYDYRFNNFQVSLLADRGTDNGVVLRYGKNLKELKNLDNTTNVYTGIVPYWKSDTEEVYLTERVVLSSHVSDYPYKIIKTVDFSQEFETAPTEAQLRTKAQSYLENNKGWRLKNNIDVSFVALWQSEEYKDIAALERVRMCDTVRVVYSKLGVDIKTRVIKTVYNVLLERYDSISLGDSAYNLIQAIQETIMEPEVQKNQSYTKDAVARATKLIQGGLGGHVVFNTNGDGEPQEILIMDTDNIQTAVNVIRMNLNGIGFSHNGYAGPFETAWTIDGSFVANYITSGTLDGALVRAGTVSANALTAEAKEELQEVHNYVSDKIFTDISVWSAGSSPQAVAPHYETIGDKKYLVLDGSGLSEYSSTAYARTLTNTKGDIHFKIHLLYHVDTEVTVPQQRFLFLDYYKTTGSSSWTTWKWLPAQTIPANTDFTWDVSFDVTDVNANKNAYFGIYYIPGTTMYIEELSVYSSIDAYATSGMDFNEYGLSMIASEIDANHSYIPYDAMTNVSRWKLWSQQNGGTITYESHTFGDGTTHDCIVLDGTNTVGFNHAEIISDLIGSLDLEISYKFRYATNCIVASNWYSSGASFTNTQGTQTGASWDWYYSGAVFEADKEYSVTLNKTVSDVDYYNEDDKPTIQLSFNPGYIIYFYDLKVTGPSSAYKTAALKFTADGLDSVVQAGSIISTINQSAEQVSIQADKINLTGDVSLHGAFAAYDPNDQTNYVDMTEGEITIYNNNDAKFAVTCDSLITNAGAGIYFGDLEDPTTLLRYTSVTQDMVRTPYLYVRADGSHDSGGTPPTGAFLRCEGDAYFYGSVYLEDNAGLTVDNITTPANAASPSVFWYEVDFKGNVFNASGGLVFVSDKRKKKNIKDLAIEAARSFIMALKPRIFKFKKDEGANHGVRDHHGFIAQEVKEAMNGDWGVYCEDQEKDFIGLRYDEFIADMVAVIQSHEKKIQELENEIKKMKGERNDDANI